MNVNDAMKGVKLIGFDTSPFIYYTENHPIYLDIMRGIFRAIRSNRIQVVTSLITLSEVLVKPLRTNDLTTADTYRTLLRNTRSLQLKEINRATVERAALLRATYNLKLVDAIQVATAILSDCDAFLTNDVGVKRVTEIRVFVLDELELDPAS